MKKNLVNCVLAAMVVSGCFLIESSTVVALCLIGAAAFGFVGEDINRIAKYEEAMANSENIDYLLDCVEFGEWNVNV